MPNSNLPVYLFINTSKAIVLERGLSGLFGLRGGTAWTSKRGSGRSDQRRRLQIDLSSPDFFSAAALLHASAHDQLHQRRCSPSAEEEGKWGSASWRRSSALRPVRPRASGDHVPA